MINSFSILFGLIFVGFVVVRAAMLDRMQPWFQRGTAGRAAPPPKPAPTGKFVPGPLAGARRGVR